MSAEVAQLSVVIKGDTEDAEKKIKGVNSQVKESDGFFKGALKSALGFAGGAAIVAGVGTAVSFVTSNLTDMVKQGMDGNRSMAILAQGLKSTHDASGMTLDSLDALSNSIMNMTGIDDDSTKAAEQMLLTFTGIGKTVFPQATQAAADMATRMNGGAIPSAQQMQQQALLLGKALNDPTKGLTALTREGVTFSDQQKQQIAHMVAVGNTAGAQAIMIAELNKEFGGSAKAAGQANGGIAILSAQFDNLKQTLGQAIVPVLLQVMSAITPLTSQLSAALPGALAVVTPLFQNIWTILRLVGEVVAHNLQPAFDALKRVFGDVGNAVKGVDFNSIITTVTQLAGEISDGLNTAIVTLIPIVRDLATWFMNHIVPAAQQLYTWFQAHVMPVLQQLAQVIVTNLLPALKNIAEQILTKLVPALQNLWNKISPVLIPVFQLLGWIIGNVVGPVLGFLIGVIADVINIIANIIGKIGDFIGWLGHLGEGWNKVTHIIQEVVGLIANWIKVKLAEMQMRWDQLVATIQGIVKKGFDFIHNLIKEAIDKVVGWFKWLYDHNTYFHDLVNNIISIFTKARQWITDTWNNIVKFVVDLWDNLRTRANVLWSALVFLIDSKINEAKAKIMAVWNNITGFLGGIWNNIVTAAQNGWNRFTGAISGALDNVKRTMGQLIDNIKKPIDDLGGKLFQAGKDLIQHLIDGIKNMAGGVGNAIHNAISGGLSALGFHDIPGFASGGVLPPGFAIVGEHGPELMVNPGARVYSASETANLMRPAVSASGSGGAGGGGRTQHIIVQLDRRTLAEAVVEEIPDVVRVGTGIKLW